MGVFDGYRKTLEAASRHTDGEPDRGHAGRARGTTKIRTRYFSKDYAVEDAGIRTGELIGYRAWCADRGPWLRSFNSAVWAPMQPMRGNVHEGHGVFAFKSSELLNRAMLRENMAALASGTVWMWGEVIEHANGYRAEYAKIRSIDRAPWQLDKWRELYGLIPARPYDMYRTSIEPNLPPEPPELSIMRKLVEEQQEQIRQLQMAKRPPVYRWPDD